MARRRSPHRLGLYLDDVNVFRRLQGVRGLSLVVDHGEVRAIIGPNGAGKTTMMDVVTGKTRPDTGTVYFDGRHRAHALDEAEIAELGIGRKFQKPSVFDDQTVAENLELGVKSAAQRRRDPVRRRERGEKRDDRRRS